MKKRSKDFGCLDTSQRGGSLHQTTKGQFQKGGQEKLGPQGIVNTYKVKEKNQPGFPEQE